MDGVIECNKVTLWQDYANEQIKIAFLHFKVGSKVVLHYLFKD